MLPYAGRKLWIVGGNQRLLPNRIRRQEGQERFEQYCVWWQEEDVQAAVWRCHGRFTCNILRVLLECSQCSQYDSFRSANQLQGNLSVELRGLYCLLGQCAWNLQYERTSPSRCQASAVCCGRIEARCPVETVLWRPGGRAQMAGLYSQEFGSEKVSS